MVENGCEYLYWRKLTFSIETSRAAMCPELTFRVHFSRTVMFPKEAITAA
jgi:hypothetical protein